MSPSAPPAFGKRQSLRKRAAASRPAPPVTPDQRAFFAALREADADAEPRLARVVPRSWRAAFLAGLVVACGLVGLDASGQSDLARLAPLTEALGVAVDTHAVTLAVLVVGLLGGARAAGVSVLLVHAALARLEQTSPAAYAAGGAGAAAAFAGLAMAAFGHAPAHGWPLEIATGAIGGFLYRIFAGARRA